MASQNMSADIFEKAQNEIKKEIKVTGFKRFAWGGFGSVWSDDQGRCHRFEIHRVKKLKKDIRLLEFVSKKGIVPKPLEDRIFTRKQIDKLEENEGVRWTMSKIYDPFDFEFGEQQQTIAEALVEKYFELSKLGLYLDAKPANVVIDKTEERWEPVIIDFDTDWTLYTAKTLASRSSSGSSSSSASLDDDDIIFMGMRAAEQDTFIFFLYIIFIFCMKAYRQYGSKRCDEFLSTFLRVARKHLSSQSYGDESISEWWKGDWDPIERMLRPWWIVKSKARRGQKEDMLVFLNQYSNAYRDLKKYSGYLVLKKFYELFKKGEGNIMQDIDGFIIDESRHPTRHPTKRKKRRRLGVVEQLMRLRF